MFKQLKFESVFGCKVGEKKAVTVYPDKETNQFEIELTTPSHSEENMAIEFPVMQYVFFRDILKMELWGGDKMLYETNRKFDFFINESGIDPLTVPLGSAKAPRSTKARDTWLLPNTKYKVRVYRTVGPSPKNPIELQYSATDDNEVQFTDVPVPTPTPGPTPTDSIEMTFNGVKFICIPVID